MREKETLCKEGIIRDVRDGEVLVEIIVSSACGGCHAKSICIPSDRREEKIWVNTMNSKDYSVGEVVNLFLDSSAGNKAVILAYVVPLCILLIILFVLFAFTANELLSVGISVICVLSYYLILKSFNKKLEKEIIFRVQKKVE